MVFLPAQFGVGNSAIFLITLFDVVEQGTFGHGVVGAELHSALKHQVLQIVSQSGGFGRVVLTTRSDGDKCLNARFLLIDRQVNFQAVVEGVDARLHQVAGHGLVLVIFSRCAHSEQQQANSKNVFNILHFLICCLSKLLPPQGEGRGGALNSHNPPHGRAAG